MASAQNVNGVVLGSATYAPVPGATVYVELVGQDRVIETTSDSDGLFAVDIEPESTVRLVAEVGELQSGVKMIEVTRKWLRTNTYIKLFMDGLSSDTMDRAAIQDIELVDELPEGYRILEARPVEENTYERSGFNVNTGNRNQRTTVNVEEVKEENERRNDASMPPEVAREEAGTSVFRESNVYYDPGKAQLGPSVIAELRDAATVLAENPTYALSIIGYADAGQEASIGDYIAQLRVDIITAFLMREGVPFEQLNVAVRGNGFLENGCYANVDCTDAEHGANRRVELFFVER